jgi:23S rRNA (guanosine2251-2'-O)-methyltransferase
MYKKPGFHQGRRSRSYARRQAEQSGQPAQPAERPKESGEMIYGRRSVFEAFQAGKRSFHKLWIVEGAGGGITEDILRLARERGVPIEWAKREWLDRAAPGHHQGVMVQATAAEFLELEDFLKKQPRDKACLIIALDEIQDPQNMGAILRSAGFFGVSAAIVPRWRSAPVGETAARASSGAIEHVPLVRVQNLVESMQQLREEGFQILGADAGGKALWDHPKNPRTVLILGSEGKGLRRLVRERCDQLVAIPRRSPVDSLNVAAAAAIFLYEFYRGKTNQPATPPTTL